MWRWRIGRIREWEIWLIFSNGLKPPTRTIISMESKLVQPVVFFFVPPYLGSFFFLFGGPRLAIGPGQRRFVVGLGSLGVFWSCFLLGVVIYVKSHSQKKMVVGYYSYSQKKFWGKNIPQKSMWNLEIWWTSQPSWDGQLRPAWRVEFPPNWHGFTVLFSRKFLVIGPYTPEGGWFRSVWVMAVGSSS